MSESGGSSENRRESERISKNHEESKKIKSERIWKTLEDTAGILKDILGCYKRSEQN